MNVTEHAARARTALVTALRESASLLKAADQQPGKADAVGVRHIQSRLYELLGVTADRVTRVQAFWLDHLAEDVFYNLFGDTPYTPDTQESTGTETARQEVCREMYAFFECLANALEEGVQESQFDCWSTFISVYLDRIDRLNQELGRE